MKVTNESTELKVGAIPFRGKNSISAGWRRSCSLDRNAILVGGGNHRQTARVAAPGQVESLHEKQSPYLAPCLARFVDVPLSLANPAPDQGHGEERVFHHPKVEVEKVISKNFMHHERPLADP